MIRRARIPATVILAAGVAAVSGCGDDRSPVEPARPAFSIAPAQAPPGSLVEVRGLGNVSVATHWIDVGGERAELLGPGGDVAYFTVPLFGAAAGSGAWPDPPGSPVTVELRNATGTAMVADRRLTVLPLERADGTLARLVDDYAAAIDALKRIADAIPPSAGESARFAWVIARVLDSLHDDPDHSMALAVAELQAASPGIIPLLDALLAAGGAHRIEADAAYRLEGIAHGVTAPGPASTARMSHATSQFILQTGPGGHGGAGAIEALGDETLSMLMQLAVYLKQNTDFGANTAKQISTILGLADALGLGVDGGDNPIGKVLGLVAANTSARALLLNKYLVAALPSQLDSLTIQLASTTLAPSQRTVAAVHVHASNNPEAVTLGDLISSLQAAVGTRAEGGYLEKLTQFVLDQVNDLLQRYADGNPGFAYDSGIVDLWSVPRMSFRAQVTTRRLVELRSAAPDIVQPLADEVNWIARADSGATQIRVEPAVDNAAIPVLVEWLADIVSTNSGPASNLVLGAFGEQIRSSAPQDVRIETQVCRSGEIELALDFGMEGDNPTIAGPLLESGREYLITVSGTYSIWRSMWSDGVCQGSPGSAAQGNTGFDAEYRFAVPVGSSLCDRSVPDHSSKFRMSLDGGDTFEHIHPDPAEYNPEHVYHYRVTGQGAAIHFRLAEDSARGDDYGILSIRVACPPES